MEVPNIYPLNVSADVEKAHDNVTYISGYASDGINVTNPNDTYTNSNVYNDVMYQPDSVDKMLDALNLYAIPLIIVAGLLGNGLSFFIFVSSQLRLLSSSVYLAFLNVVDSVFLLTVFFGVWLDYVHVPLVHRKGWCQMIVYMSFVSAFLSVYTVVCFTVERAIVVFKPFHRSRWCSTKKAKCTVLLFLVAALILYSFAVWTHEVVTFNIGEPPIPYTTCYFVDDYFSVLKILSSVDTVLTLLVPSVTIGVINFAIAGKIYHVVLDRRNNLLPNVNTVERKTFLREYVFGHKSSSQSNASYTMHMMVPAEHSKRGSSVTSRGSANQRSAPVTASASNLLQLRTTRTLLLVSSVFVLLNLPSHSLKIYVFIAQLMDPSFHPPLNLLRWQEFVQFLYYLNFSANFFLYCAFSMTFRCALRRSFRRSKTRLKCFFRKCCGRSLHVYAGHRTKAAPV